MPAFLKSSQLARAVSTGLEHPNLPPCDDENVAPWFTFSHDAMPRRRRAHDARPVGEEEIQPITVFMDVPETTREWRIYRSVDAGPLALVKSGISGGPLGSPDAAVSDVIIQDKAMPPNGALMRYFGQCFDQNNNPSPLKFLAEVPLLPAPATPMLNAPIMEGSVPGSPIVRLKWFCPTPGVQRFRITLVPVDAPLNVNEGAPQTPGGITRVPYALFGGKPLQSLPYQLVGETETKFAPVSHAFDLPPIIGDGPPLQAASANAAVRAARERPAVRTARRTCMGVMACLSWVRGRRGGPGSGGREPRRAPFGGHGGAEGRAPGARG